MLSWSELSTRGEMSHRVRDRFALKKIVRIVVHSSAPVLVSQTPLRPRVLSGNSEPGVVQKHLKRVRRLACRFKQSLTLNEACPRSRSRAGRYSRKYLSVTRPNTSSIFASEAPKPGAKTTAGLVPHSFQSAFHTASSGCGVHIAQHNPPEAKASAAVT